MKVTTSFNGLGWTCVDADTYDGAPDAGKPSNIIGTGHTEAEARADWQDQFDQYQEEQL
jgi:hypothetical protein